MVKPLDYKEESMGYTTNIKIRLFLVDLEKFVVFLRASERLLSGCPNFSKNFSKTLSPWPITASGKLMIFLAAKDELNAC
jgi:hypothetical protein